MKAVIMHPDDVGDDEWILMVSPYIYRGEPTVMDFKDIPAPKKPIFRSDTIDATEPIIARKYCDLKKREPNQ